MHFPLPLFLISMQPRTNMGSKRKWINSNGLNTEVGEVGSFCFMLLGTDCSRQRFWNENRRRK